MDSELINRLLEKNPTLKKNQSLLESIQPGAYCYHNGWGVGCIQGIDEANNRIQISFELYPEPKSMDLAFCLQKLQFLPENHIIVVIRKDLKASQKILRNKPSEWVMQALQSFPEHKATALELETILSQALSPFFKPMTFKRWWIAMQKTLIKDPMICIPKNKTDFFSLREQPVSPEQKLAEAFLSSKQPAEKIKLGLQLCQSIAQWNSIRENIPQLLEAITPLCAHKALSVGEQLEACWIRNDLSHFLDASAQEPQPTESSMVQDVKALSEIAEVIPCAFQERFFHLLQQTYPQEWQSLLLSFLKHGSTSLIDACFHFLWHHEQEKLLKNTLAKWLQEQNLDSSLLLWIVKHRKLPNYESFLAPFFQSPSLLICIFQSIDNEALNILPGRQLALAEELNKDATLISDLLKNTDLHIASDLARSLMNNQGLDDLKKRSLLARFIKIFPELQKLAAPSSGPTEEAVWVSASSLEKAKEEYEELVNDKIPANKAAIAKAREMGDLRENSEYKMARQDQSVLLSRKSMLEKSMNHCRVIRPQEVKTDKVNIGTCVTLKGKQGESLQYTILGAWDSNPQKNILSYQTPFAQSILGKAVGETVTFPDGTTASIQSIQRCDA